MHIKFTEKCRANGRGYVINESAELPDVEALALIRMGRAVEIEAPKPRPKKKKVSEE